MNAQSAAADAAPAQGSDAMDLAIQACSAAGVSVHEVREATGCRVVLDVLNRIWGVTDPDVVDLGFIVALAHAGNLVLRADVDGRPVGAAIGFGGPPGAPFHSHIVGVTSEMHGRGVGRAIKLYQRAWCLNRGLNAMSWTYDPLVARNAYFNVHRLGVQVSGYHPDFYGTMRDSINAGQRSDRIVASWDLTADPLTERHRSAPLDNAPKTVAVIDTAGPAPLYLPEVAATATDTAVAVAIPLPRDIEHLRRTDPELAQHWRSATRAAFTDLLGAGWQVTDVTRDGTYVLQRERTP